MGFLIFFEEKEILARILRALWRRKLHMDKTEYWEGHGPHQDMNYQVYIGMAHLKSDFFGGSFYVAIYPWAMYEINDPGDWWNAKSGNRIRFLR